MSELRDAHLPDNGGDRTASATLEPPWFDDNSDLRQQVRRRWLVMASATVPWVVVLVLLIVRSGGDQAHPDEPFLPSSVDEHTNTDHQAASPGLDGLQLHQLQGNWRSSPGPDAAAAVATMVARAWVTGVEPRLDIVSRPATHTSTYAEHFVVEAIEQLDQSLAVVTLLASVIDGDLRVSVRRLAVPVWTSHQLVSPAGQPWWLPEVELQVAPLQGERIDDPQLMVAAAEAIRAAGYLDVELEQLERTDAWPWRATVQATTPAGTQVTTPVLLRRHIDRFVVAGTVLEASPGQQTSAEAGIGRFLP